MSEKLKADIAAPRVMGVPADPDQAGPVVSVRRAASASQTTVTAPGQYCRPTPVANGQSAELVERVDAWKAAPLSAADPEPTPRRACPGRRPDAILRVRRRGGAGGRARDLESSAKA